MPVTRLTLINDQLILCGHNPFNSEDDGSPEWNVCSAAYDAAVEHLLDAHDWNFGKSIETIQSRTDPDDPNWEDAYAKPSGCLHLIRVMDTDGAVITDWRILGNKILVNESDGILAEIVEEPSPTEWPGTFVKALRCFINAGIYRGLNKDPGEARREEAAGEQYLALARPRTDLEEPGKTRFISSLANARRSRRG